jgi:hypothetical protein
VSSWDWWFRAYQPPSRFYLPLLGRRREFALIGDLWVDDQVTYPEAEALVLDGARGHPIAGHLFGKSAPRAESSGGAGCWSLQSWRMNPMLCRAACRRTSIWV